MNKTKTLKKVLSMVMILMMVVSTMVIMPLTANAACAVVTATTPAGDGSEGNPYRVGSHAEWAGLQALAAGGTLYNTVCYVKITADFALGHSCALDSSSYPSTSNAGSIKWQIDGQGHTISNTIIQLIMGTVGGVTIKNLNVEMNQTNGEAYGAALIGVVCSNANGAVVIDNCKVSGVMNYSRSSVRVAGGFIGNIYSGSPDVTVKNCINNAELYTSTAIAHPFGGIVGGIEAGTLKIENCINNGAITSPGGQVGGIVGKRTSGTLEISNCVNNGTITTTGTDTTSASTSYAGGILGYTSATATITNCINNGATSAMAAASDMIGRAAGNGAVIRDCYTTVDMPLAGAGSTGAIKETVEEGVTMSSVRAGITAARTSETTSAAWDGSVATEEPSKENPDEPNSATNRYLIEDGADLAWFSALNTTSPVTTAYYLKLANNIDMSGANWTKSMVHNVVADIDGQNFAILNLTLSGSTPGFFGMTYCAVSANLTINNLHFVNVSSSVGSSNGGFIVSYTSGTPTITMNNVTVQGTITSSNTTRLSAFVGNIPTAATVKLTNCISDVNIYNSECTPSYGANQYVGGFVGYVENASANVELTNCIQDGDLGAGGSAYRGALVGLLKGSLDLTNVFCNTNAESMVFHATWHTVTISDCYSNDALTEAANADAIAEINRMGIDFATTTVPAATTLRLKLTDDFGFMPIAAVPTGLSAHNPYVTYGVVVLQVEVAADATADEIAEAVAAMTAETIQADGKKVAGGSYNMEDARFQAAFTDVTVATMNKYFCYLTYLEVGGQTLYGTTVQNINCYERASALATTTDAETIAAMLDGEQALYGAMVAYHDAYVAYLNRHNLTVEGAN